MPGDLFFHYRVRAFLFRRLERLFVFFPFLFVNRSRAFSELAQDDRALALGRVDKGLLVLILIFLFGWFPSLALALASGSRTTPRTRAVGIYQQNLLAFTLTLSFSFTLAFLTFTFPFALTFSAGKPDFPFVAFTSALTLSFLLSLTGTVLSALSSHALLSLLNRF